MSEQPQVELPVSGEQSRRNRKATNEQLQSMPSSQARDYMLRDIRSWGWTLVILGAIHLFTSGFLDSSWGILLIIVGLASFFFKDAAMFVVYSVTLAWAAISNLISFNSGWMGFAVIQIILAVQIFRRFRAYHNAQSNLATEESYPLEFSSEPVELTRAQKLFPVTSLILGLIGLAGVGGLSIMAFIGQMIGLAVPGIVYLSIDLSFILGILGLAMGLAAVLSDFPNRGQAIIGSVAGGLAMGIELGLIILFNFIL